MVMSEVRCVCDLCAIGIQQDKMCYIEEYNNALKTACIQSIRAAQTIRL
jgi:hypothetical protein